MEFLVTWLGSTALRISQGQWFKSILSIASSVLGALVITKPPISDASFNRREGTALRELRLSWVFRPGGVRAADEHPSRHV